MTVETETIEKLRTEAVRLFVPLQQKSRTSDDVFALPFNSFSWDIIREDNLAVIASATIAVLGNAESAYVAGKQGLDPAKVTYLELMIPVEATVADTIDSTTRYMLRSWPLANPKDITVRLVTPVKVVAR